MKEKYWKDLATQDMGIEEVKNSYPGCCGLANEILSAHLIKHAAKRALNGNRPPYREPIKVGIRPRVDHPKGYSS